MTKKLMVICLDPQDKPVYFVVPTSCDQEGVEYYVHEHTCPTNLFLRGCEEIIIDGDTDPHGLFRFVKLVDWPKELDEMTWSKILPEAFQ